jgi:MFS family permease
MNEESKLESPSPMQSRYAHAWRALRHRNFRLYIVGQGISVIGTWMTRIAMAWLVYRLTHSALMLGTIGFANQISMFLLAPVAGVVIDRVNRQKLLMWTQALLMAHSLTLAALTLTHTITVPTIFCLAIFQGLVNTFDMPTRQSFYSRMVEDREDLTNAIALNSAIFNCARLLGPSLAGMLIAATSEGWCFLIDGISFAAVLTSVAMMRIPAEAEKKERAHPVEELREGWNYMVQAVAIRDLLGLFMVVCLMGWPFTTLMPVFAAQVLHGGPHTLGFLMGALGLGALTGSVSLSLRRTVRGLVGTLPLAALGMGCGLILFGFSKVLWVSLILMLFTGFSLLRGTVGTNTLVQTLLDDKMRGRVMAYYTLVLEGMGPWGALSAGTLAERLGAPHAVMISGTACILGSVWFWLRIGKVRAAMRPTFERLGIVPVLVVSDGIES